MRQFRSTFPVLAIVLAGLAFLSACSSLEVRERLSQAEIAFATVVETATDLHRAGVIDDETAAQLTPAFVEANRLLERAHRAVVDGDFEIADEHMRAAEALIALISRRISRDE